MQVHMLGWPILVLTITLGAVVPVNAQQIATRGIHTTIVDLPVPAGYQDATTPELVHTVQKLVTGQNRLLAVFIPTEQAQLARAGKPTGPLDRWILVQTPKAAEGMNISASDFSQVRREVREGLGTSIGEAVAQTNERLGRLADETLRNSRVRQSSGAQLEADTLEAIVVSLPASVVRPGAGLEQSVQKVTTALAMVRVKNKILAFYTSKAGEDSSDNLTFVRAQALQLASRALAINR